MVKWTVAQIRKYPNVKIAQMMTNTIENTSTYSTDEMIKYTVAYTLIFLIFEI